MLSNENSLFFSRFAKQSCFMLAASDITKYQVSYHPIASLASPKLSPPAFDSDIQCACSVHVDLSQWPFIQGFPILFNRRDALVLYIRYCKVVLIIGQNGGFCVSISMDDTSDLFVKL